MVEEQDGSKPQIAEELIMDAVAAPRSSAQRLTDELLSKNPKSTLGLVAVAFASNWFVGVRMVDTGDLLIPGVGLLALSAGLGAMLSTVAGVKIPEALNARKLKQLARESSKERWTRVRTR